MKKLIIILDPAHGEEVAGKRSPDGLHREYKWSRDILKKLEDRLQHMGYIVEFTTTGNREPGLSVRKNFATNLKTNQGQTKLLISLHNNAAGNGTIWMNATGVEVFTTKGQTKSDEYAEIVLKQLMKDFPNLKFRTDLSDGDLDKEENFTVLTGSGYSAMLIEWLFQDCKKDVELLNDYDTNYKLVISLCNAIETINNKL